MYIGQNDSANDRRDFIIRRQGCERLGDTHKSTARYKPTNKYIHQSPCAQPEEILPLQISCYHQRSSRIPGHLQYPNRDVTLANCTITPGAADQALAVGRFVPTIPLVTANGKGKGFSNNHTTHNGGNGEKSPPPITRYTASEDTPDIETIRTWNDVVLKITHPNQQAPRYVWNTSWHVHSSCIDQYTWDPGQNRVNISSRNTNLTSYHQIPINAYTLGTRNKALETVTTQTLKNSRNA